MIFFLSHPRSSIQNHRHQNCNATLAANRSPGTQILVTNYGNYRRGSRNRWGVSGVCGLGPPSARCDCDIGASICGMPSCILGVIINTGIPLTAWSPLTSGVLSYHDRDGWPYLTAVIGSVWCWLWGENCKHTERFFIITATFTLGQKFEFTKIIPGGEWGLGREYFGIENALLKNRRGAFIVIERKDAFYFLFQDH